MVANVLWKLRNGKENDLPYEELMRQAARIAINRTIAGVHFPVDTAAGHLLGTTLAEYFICRCEYREKREDNPSDKDKAVFWQHRFLGDQFDGKQDFSMKQLREPHPKHIPPVDHSSASGSKILGWLWDKAADEWR